MKEIITLFDQEYEFDLDDPDFQLRLFGLLYIETVDYSFENDKSDVYWVVNYNFDNEEETFHINNKDEMQKSIQETIYAEYKWILEQANKIQNIKGFNDYLTLREII